MPPPLLQGFLRSCTTDPERPAVEVAGEVFTYEELRRLAFAFSATLDQHASKADPPLTAVFAHRSPVAFAGVLAALARGHGYVPLNRTFPAERTGIMLARSESQAIIVDKSSAQQLPAILPHIEHRLVVLAPEISDLTDLARQWPKHTFLGEDSIASSPLVEPAAAASAVDEDALAYLLFTSGSTGTPKGVAVAQRNVCHFVDVMADRYEIGPTDRFSQTFDMTFDLSAFDMFVAWERGACVCCPTVKELLSPGRFIDKSQLTVWFSVPSLGIMMKRLGALKPDRFPGVRLSLFCGEPLPVEIAREWARAAPHSVIENLYGPTELTIACALYRWDTVASPVEAELGIVPIGYPYPDMKVLIASDELREVAVGDDGELLVAGPQVTLGYWRDPEKTQAAFVVPPETSAVHYRTGDRVRQRRPGGPLLYVGRVDHQIKVRGYRVELGEIESAVRDLSGADAVVAVGWPLLDTGASGVEVFVVANGDKQENLIPRLAQRLPEYMLPRRIHYVTELPLNVNGKFDRPALVARLREGTP